MGLFPLVTHCLSAKIDGHQQGKHRHAPTTFAGRGRRRAPATYVPLEPEMRWYTLVFPVGSTSRLAGRGGGRTTPVGRPGRRPPRGGCRRGDEEDGDKGDDTEEEEADATAHGGRRESWARMDAGKRSTAGFGWGVGGTGGGGGRGGGGGGTVEGAISGGGRGGGVGGHMVWVLPLEMGLIWVFSILLCVTQTLG